MSRVLDKIVINESLEYEYYMITLYDDIFEVTLKTTDCGQVAKDLETITTVDLYNTENLLMKRVTDYSTYSSVTFIKNLVIDASETVDAVKVVFKKTSIIEKVEELDRIVNGKVDESTMALEDFREYKIGLLGEECRKHVQEGLDVETSKGTMHFTYNYDDQFNIKTLFDSAVLVRMDVPYHSSKNVCTIFSWQDAIKIYVALESNLLYHMTYCNALNMMIREDLESKEEIAAITYGQEISEDRKADMEEALKVGETLMDTILVKCGLKEDEEDNNEEVEKDGESEVDVDASGVHNIAE